MAQERIGRYQVLERIAAGGQATVYRVWDTVTGAILALKVMHPPPGRGSRLSVAVPRERVLRMGVSATTLARVWLLKRLQQRAKAAV